MSRVSLSQRLRAIDAAIRKSDPYAYRVHHLPARERRWFDEWQDARQRLIAQFEDVEPGSAYEAMLDGRLNVDPPPWPVQVALGLDQSSVTIPADATAHEAATIYETVLDEGTGR